VTLRASALVYGASATISITLSNQSNQTIYFADHLTACSVVLLERQKTGTQPSGGTSGAAGVSPCLLKTVTRFHALGPKQQLVVKLVAPTSGWPAGLYRAALSSHPAPTAASGTPILSAAFTISPHVAVP
jgi:hypothetical protein